MSGSIVTSNLQTLRLGEEKTKKKKQDKNIISASATQGDHNNYLLTILNIQSVQLCKIRRQMGER